MALQLKTADGYGPIFWEHVLDEIRTILKNSSDFGTIYISPKYKNIGTQSIRLWGNGATTETLWKDKWSKRYNVDINLYLQGISNYFVQPYVYLLHIFVQEVWFQYKAK